MKTLQNLFFLFCAILVTGCAKVPTSGTGNISFDGKISQQEVAGITTGKVVNVAVSMLPGGGLVAGEAGDFVEKVIKNNPKILVKMGDSISSGFEEVKIWVGETFRGNITGTSPTTQRKSAHWVNPDKGVTEVTTDNPDGLPVLHPEGRKVRIALPKTGRIQESKPPPSSKKTTKEDTTIFSSIKDLFD